MDWTIRDDSFDVEQIAHLGNKHLVGNGYMGIRGTLEEYGKEQLAAINLSGIYDQVGEGWREPLNAPNGLYTHVSVDGTAYRLPQSAPLSHSQVLDFRRGLHTRRTCWQTERGELTITSERLASMAEPHLICMRYTIEADFSGEVTLVTGIDADVWDIHGPHYAGIALDHDEDILTALATTGEGKAVATCAAIHTDFEAVCRITTTAKRILREYRLRAQPGAAYSFTKCIAVYTSQDGPGPLEQACAGVRQAAGLGYDALKEAHVARWESLWGLSEIIIEGDGRAMQALNYSIYHLHCIAPRPFASRSIAARGLSGQTYKGAVFWDTEMYMLDFFLNTEPEVARTLLRYRIDTLDGARRKAQEYGFEGAYYAWESQEGGYDACSDYNITDVFTGRPMRTYFRDRQVHISSAVVHALMRYVHHTGDASILVEGGAEVIIECARFYLSRLVKRVTEARYEIHDVVGPDEYHERVDNNAYTNRMARLTFDAAQEALALLAEADPAAYEALDARYSIADDIAAYTDASEHLYVPAPDERGIIEQFDGYFDLEDASIEEVRSRLMDPREYWGGAYGIAAHTQIIKQADVVTMLWLFRDAYSPDILQKNWAYYEPRTEHGSSLSACMYALLACRIGAAAQAYPFFLKTASADLHPGGKEWAGLVYIGGTHPAAAGGAWMTAVRGFAGLAVKDGQIRVRPCLPAHWDRLRFKIRLGEEIYGIDMTQDGYRIDKMS